VKRTTKDEETKATTDAEKAESSPADIHQPVLPTHRRALTVLDSQTRADPARTRSSTSAAFLSQVGGRLAGIVNRLRARERALKRTLNWPWGAPGRRFGRS